MERSEMLVGAVIAALALAGAVLALIGSLTWALAVLCALGAAIGLAVIVTHAASRRRDELLIRKLGQVEGELRTASSTLTRAGERLRKLDKRGVELGAQSTAQVEQLDSGFAEVNRIAERSRHIARDLYDLRLTIEERGSSGRLEDG